MIEGCIDRSGSAYVELNVAGMRAEARIEAILDTGFNGGLSLPLSVAVPLGLELLYASRFELADGTIVEDELVFGGRLLWYGKYVDVEIVLTRSDEALLGTALLADMEVKLDYVHGKVWIRKHGSESAYEGCAGRLPG